MSPAHVESARALLGRNLDWQLLFSTALLQGVMPLLHKNLTALGPSLCPPDFLAALREAYLPNVAHSLRMTAELKKVLGLFDAHGIPALPFKGPVLAAYAYGDVALRQYGDLDLLVPHSELERAVDVLRARGYNPVESMTARQQRAHVRRKSQLGFADPTGPFVIELHWRFSPPSRAGEPDPQAVFARQTRCNVEGESLPSLAPDDLLLYLCLHGALHLWAKLNLICDVAQLLGTREDWNWPELLRQADQTDLRRVLLLGLALASDVLEAKLPPEVTRSIASDESVEAIGAQVREKLFDPQGAGPGLADVGPFLLRLRSHKRSRVLAILEVLFVPSLADWKFVHLPDALFPLYYLVRPFRLASDALSRRQRRE